MLKGQKWNNRVFNTFLVRDSSSAELMQMDNMVNYKGRINTKLPQIYIQWLNPTDFGDP